MTQRLTGEAVRVLSIDCHQGTPVMDVSILLIVTGLLCLFVLIAAIVAVVLTTRRRK